MQTRIVILVVIFAMICRAEVIELVPDETRFRDSLLPGQSQIYKLTKLDKGKKYELRISYPATMPAFFTIKFSKDLPSLQHLHARKLLNIEKEIFQADTNDMYVLVTAEREGISYDPKIQNSPIVYNIIVETLLLGAVPVSSIRLIVLVLVAIMIVIIGIYKYAGNKVRNE